jgi:RNA polymerase sigma-70 factor (ECF subfamily)
MADHPMRADLVESTVLYAHCNSDNVALQAEAYQTVWAYLYRVALHLVRDQLDAEALAQDCAQDALIRIHARLAECREPKAFRSWARRIVTNLCIDELRKRNRRHLAQEEPDELHCEDRVESPMSPEAMVIDWESSNSIRQGLRRAPISERSYRTMVARYLEDMPDEELAKRESERTGQTLLPSHLQVTRSKNLSKLRAWDQLPHFLG